jgi:hypothetical protein
MAAEGWLAILNAEFGNASDRALAIVAASVVEELLLGLLRGRLVPNDSSQDTLFDGPNAPLGTFSAKIDLAYRVGAISHRLARDCHLIRKIRNRFAHELEGGSFETAGVHSQVAELVRSHNDGGRIDKLLRKPYDTTRGHFLLITALIVTHLDDQVGKRVIPIHPLESDDVYACEYSG